jgi:putative membrane protein
MSRTTIAVTVAYAAYLLYAFASGALYFYIHPLYIAATVASAVVLVALAVLAWGRAGESSRMAPIILAVPVLLGALLPAQPLSPLAAGQRGLGAASIATGDDAPELALHGRTETYTIKDWVKALQADPEPARHIGKTVRVTGFVYREEGAEPDRFLVARYILKCCAVDAQPVGLPVRSSTPAPERGTWIVVDGTWDVERDGEHRRPVIVARMVTRTERPGQPYLY